jgi:diguanylate cyclase (GGDEF)-like protein
VAGFACFAVGFSHWQCSDPVKFSCYLIAAVVASTLKVTLPGIEGTLSVNFLFTFLGILELGLPETLLIVLASTLGQAYLRRKQEVKFGQFVFNWAQLTVSSAISYGAYRLVVLEVLHAPAPLALLVAATAHFFCNTAAMSIIIGFTEAKPIAKVWNENYLWSFPYYVGGGAAAGLVHLLNVQIGWQSSLLVLPPIYLMYRSYRLYLDKIETEKRHVELQRKNLELQKVSFTDVLTGLWNRRYLEEILTAEAEQVQRNYERSRGSDLNKFDHHDLVFIMVDVDFFKEVNDLHGHPAGDRFLQLVAQRLSSVVRKSDVLVRWGGEEFLIMSRLSDHSGTPAFCSRILEVMACQPFDLGHGASARKTCSAGWAPYPWTRSALEVLSAEEVICLADTALYRAKALGRNRGVGILPTDAAAAAPAAISLPAIQTSGSAFARIIETHCPTNLARTEAEKEIGRAHNMGT